MQAVDQTVRHYDRTTITLHWLTAILVAEQWLGAQVIDWFPRGPLRVDARSVHITLGVTLALVLAGRLLWRATGHRGFPRTQPGLLHWLAQGTHWLLYGLLAVMLLAGLGLAWARGDSIFGLFAIPRLGGNPALRGQLEWLHNAIGYAILAVAGLHAAAALVHHFIWQDAVLTRMWPRRA